MNTIEHTRLLIQNIENNISSDFSTGFLTKSGAVSHTQLYRDFYSLTGHSV
jgi:hypothetical protein